MLTLPGKKVLIFGETNDLFDTTIAACIKAAGGEVVYQTADCYS